MEVIVLSEVKVHVKIVSPYNADVKKYINKYPFKSDIDQLKQGSIKHDLGASIETSKPKCSVRVFPMEKKPHDSASIEKRHDIGLQSDPVVILTDIATLVNEFDPQKTASNYIENEYGLETFHHEEFSDAKTSSICKDHVSENPHGLKIDEKAGKVYKTYESHNTQDDNLEIVETVNADISLEQKSVSDKDLQNSVENTSCDENLLQYINKTKHPVPVNTTCGDLTNHVINSVNVSNIIRTTNNPENENFMARNNGSVEKISNDADSWENCSEIVPKILTENGNGNKGTQSDSRGLFWCNICNILFSSDGFLQRHLSTQKHIDNNPIHSDKRPHACSICDKRFKTKKCRKRHELIHVDDRVIPRKYPCTFCEKRFSSNRDRKRHETIHTGIKQYKCQICDKMFRLQSTLRGHKKVHSGERLYACKFCDKKFQRNVTLKEHETIHTGEELYKCEFCNRKFRYHGCLTYHKTLHPEAGGKPFECQYCNKKFSTAPQLKEHESIHTNKITFTCDQCGKTLSTYKNLKRHMAIHTKLYICDICNKRFARATYLNNHVLTHSGLKPYACSICDFQTCTSRYMQRHMKRHSRENDFSCDICGKRFVRKFLLKRHLMLHEKQVKEQISK